MTECRHHSEEEVQSDRDLLEITREVWPWGIAAGQTRPHQMRMDMSHREERQAYKEARALGTVRASYHSTAPDEMRVARVFGLTAEGSEVAYGIDRPKWTGEPVRLPKGVMPSVDNGRDVRMSCKKLGRAEFFRKPRRSERAQTREAEQILEDLGLL